MMRFNESMYILLNMQNTFKSMNHQDVVAVVLVVAVAMHNTVAFIPDSIQRCKVSITEMLSAMIEWYLG